MRCTLYNIVMVQHCSGIHNHKFVENGGRAYHSACHDHDAVADLRARRNQRGGMYRRWQREAHASELGTDALPGTVAADCHEGGLDSLGPQARKNVVATEHWDAKYVTRGRMWVHESKDIIGAKRAEHFQNDFRVPSRADNDQLQPTVLPTRGQQQSGQWRPWQLAAQTCRNAELPAVRTLDR